MMPTPDLDQLCVNTIRTLSMDAVQQANSGHPGTSMAMAPVAYALWQRHLRFDPNDPIWPNRDRFVLSMGHASMLLYSLLHLAGVKAVNPKYEALGQLSVSLDDIKRFRQLDSRCPGHPEYRWTSGVETTSGPLGQGVATSVGMALAAKWMAAHFNRPGFEMFSFNVYALAGDGCLMEGVSQEAASLAGHLKLGNLCWIYDNNRITIEGSTALAFSDDVATRFIGYGWNVTRVGDANDLTMLDRAFDTVTATTDRPTLIGRICASSGSVDGERRYCFLSRTSSSGAEYGKDWISVSPDSSKASRRWRRFPTSRWRAGEDQALIDNAKAKTLELEPNTCREAVLGKILAADDSIIVNERSRSASKCRREPDTEVEVVAIRVVCPCAQHQARRGSGQTRLDDAPVGLEFVLPLGACRRLQHCPWRADRVRYPASQSRGHRCGVLAVHSKIGRPRAALTKTVDLDLHVIHTAVRPDGQLSHGEIAPGAEAEGELSPAGVALGDLATRDLAPGLVPVPAVRGYTIEVVHVLEIVRAENGHVEPLRSQITVAMVELPVSREKAQGGSQDELVSETVVGSKGHPGRVKIEPGLALGDVLPAEAALAIDEQSQLAGGARRVGRGRSEQSGQSGAGQSRGDQRQRSTFIDRSR